MTVARPPTSPEKSRYALTDDEIVAIKRICVWTMAVLSTGAVVTAAVAASFHMKDVVLTTISTVSSPLLPHDEHGHTNVLLLGVGDRAHAGADLTDTIIVASIDPATRSIALFSLPRDLYLAQPANAAPGRINTLYSNFKRRYRRDQGLTASGVSLLAMHDVASEIERRLDIALHGVIKIDFSGFEQVIDAVGGVDVEVTRDIVDYAYPLKEGEVGLFELPAGLHHLDGTTALRYARSRHASSDFDRSARQQQILAALMATARERSLLENMGFIASVQQSLRDHMESTFSQRVLLGLGGSLIGIARDHVITMQLNTKIGGEQTPAAAGGFILGGVRPPGSGAALLPFSLSSDEDDWGQIRTLALLLFAHRQLYLDRPIFSLTAAPRAGRDAQRLRNELLRYGFMVLGDDERPMVVDGASALTAANHSSVQFFAWLLALPVNAAPDTASGSGIHLVIGTEYRFLPFATVLSAPLTPL